MAIILDANVLINLYHADILSLIYHRTECIVPAEVYEEVVVGGRQAGHWDADAIADIIGPYAEFPTEILPELSRLGLGEAAALTRYIERRGEVGSEEDVIVSDDQQFLNYVERREESEGTEIRHLNTAGLIAESGLGGILAKRQALDALARIRPRMRQRDYRAARQQLEML